MAVFQWHKSRLNAALVSLSGTVLYEMRISSDRHLDYGLITARLFREDIETYSLNAKILGICLVVPAIVDNVSQGIHSTVLNLSVEDNVLGQLRERIPDYPIAVLNDTACYAYAEYVHSALEDSYYVFVNIGSGVGAVALDHGRFFRAANGMTTQFGHFSVDRNGPQCGCGNRGCLERMIGELYLYERACKEGCKTLFAGKEDAGFEKLGKLVAQGDGQAVKLMNALAEDTAYAISNLISLFNPREVVIGGGGMSLGETYLETLGQHLSRMGFPLFMKQVGLRFSSLNKSSALKGAARYFIDQYFTFDGEMQNTLFIVYWVNGIVEFAYKVKEAYPEIPPIVPGSHGQEQFTTWATFPHLSGKRDEDFLMPSDALSGDLMLYYKYNDGKVYNFFDDPDPAIVESLKEARQLYEDGIIYEDCLSLSTYRDAMAENKAAVVMWGDIIPEPTYVNRLKTVVPDGEIASVFNYTTEPGQLLATFKAWNYQSVAKVSKNPERCLQFLEFTQQSQEIYDLFAYGIEGVHWTDEGPGKYLNISSDYRWFPYLWVWNPKYDRVVANATEKEFEMEMFLRQAPAEDFVEQWTAPLLFDTENVQDALAQYTTAQAQYYGPIFNGVVDTDEYMEMFRAAAYDSLKIIQNELQAQIDALGDRSFVNE